MASLRRNKAVPNDATSSRFLYTIMKQLDHKLIDWNLVANELEITNGHAARMRFSRFRQHMEGSPTMSRKRASASNEPKPKRAKTAKNDEKSSKAERKAKCDPGLSGVKADPGSGELEGRSTSPRVKPEPVMKNEPADFVTAGGMFDVESAGQEDAILPKQRVCIKAEPGEDGVPEGVPETVPENVPFESLIDPAIRDGGSMNPLVISEKRIKKEGRPQPAFALDDYASPEVESKTSFPGLPFLEILESTPGA